ncbi:MAG: Na+/H+ antiporter NhaC family protein [Bacteroidales bacterium]|jgi:Na+/H+ antiporter NhaC|nr:hypothetical protein [Bacteroidales bacterium]MDD3702287.1 Na+/H+ antiporter NhaC family protein [Bacteroidales bacterium]MDY0369553.1 Na+/H+ antiporter NhaC family protein [Bacteroidales bacterium]
MRFFKSTMLLLLIVASGMNTISAEEHFRVIVPDIILGPLDQQIQIEIVSDSMANLWKASSGYVTINSREIQAVADDGILQLTYRFHKKEQLHIELAGMSYQATVNPIPLWMSIIPPLIAILLALLLREVFVSLFLGIMSGTSIIFFYQGAGFLTALTKGFLTVIDTYVIESLLNKGHLSIIIFSMLIGGMVQLISANGGMQGIVRRLSRYATDSRSGQLVAWLMGIVIFFDDYANTLVVGNTMRPVFDRLRISREKLAYIVDSTAAPVAAVAFVTTWIGAELSYIQDGLATIGLEMSAYTVFFNSLAYSFYPFLTLGFMLILIISRRDFGPMRKAELLAAKKQIAEPDIKPEHSHQESIPKRAFNAVIPILIIIIGTLCGLVYTGWDSVIWADDKLSVATKISETIGNSDSYLALLWASSTALAITILLTIGQGLLSLQKIVESVLKGFNIMLPAILILILAWSVALVTQHMHTADFIANTLFQFNLTPYLLPALTFLLAALIAFSTGTSWGTMAILYPLILPTSWLLTENADYISSGQQLSLFYSVVSAVLSGAVLGDHVSPISDTTIMSSMASGCNHIAHVRTQMPYALVVGAVAVFFGSIPAAFSIVSPLVWMAVSMMILWLIIRLTAKPMTEKQ